MTRSLLIVLAAGLAFGCAPAYRVTIPVLDCRPARFEKEGQKFVIFCESDAAKIVRELKAACLALGGTREECQAD